MSGYSRSLPLNGGHVILASYDLSDEVIYAEVASEELTAAHGVWIAFDNGHRLQVLAKALDEDAADKLLEVIAHARGPRAVGGSDTVRVPRVPTQAMLDAAWRVTKGATPDERIAAQIAMTPRQAHDLKMRQRWAAMIAAVEGEAS